MSGASRAWRRSPALECFVAPRQVVSALSKYFSAPGHPKGFPSGTVWLFPNHSGVRYTSDAKRQGINEEDL